MTEAEITAIRKIVAELEEWDYPTLAKSPDDLLRPWLMTRFERDMAVKALRAIADEQDVMKALHAIADKKDEARVANVTNHIKAIDAPHSMAQAYLHAATAGNRH